MALRVLPNSWSLLTKIVLLNLAVLLVCFLALVLYILPLYEDRLLEHRKQYIAELVNMASLVLEDYHQKVEGGELTLTSAQESAVAALKTMSRDNGYYWVHDTELQMIMHPYVKTLEKQSLVHYADPTGKLLFVEMNRLVGVDGEGDIAYLWPKPGHDQPVAKLSHVKLFKPWGWIVGSGMYLDDINTEVAALRYKTYLVTVIVLLLLLAFSVVAAINIKRPIQQALRLLQEVPADYLPADRHVGIDETGQLLDAMIGLVGRLKEAKERAEEASSAKGEFLARMSHEIRNPMNAVNGLTELALQQAESAQQVELLQGVRQSASHLLGLINQVLDYSKLEAGAVELEQVPFRLRETVTGLLLPFTLKARSKGLAFHYSFSEDLPDQVIGDPVRLRQVMINLVSNALKFTDSGSINIQIMQQWQQDQLYVQVVVTDTGIGIAADKLEQIFEPYRQAEHSTTRQFGGTGLGLSIVATLVNLMQGQLEVTSNPGAGSSFTLMIPLKLDERSEGREKGQFVDSPMRPRSILVAEDNQINSMLLRKQLESIGHQVTTVTNGQQTLEAWQSGQFDLIIMDVLMPVMDGLQASQKIRDQEQQQHAGAHIPIIALSGQDTEDDLQVGIQAGFDRYLCKPVNFEELVETLKSL